jgi:hypothetical protein
MEKNHCEAGTFAPACGGTPLTGLKISHLLHKSDFQFSTLNSQFTFVLYLPPLKAAIFRYLLLYPYQ